MLDLGGNELEEIQAEVQAVKAALRSEAPYLGMKGETLAKYFLQLNEKENLFLSRQLRLVQPAVAHETSPAAASNGGPWPAAVPAVGQPAVVQPAVVQPAVVQPAVVQPAVVQPAPAREPPPGAVRAINREDRSAVVSHLCDYEASADQVAKGLRMLSGLAYTDAAAVGGDSAVLPQLLRVLALHPKDANVKLRAMHTFSNVAYDAPLAMTKLSTPEVLGAILSVFASGAAKQKEPAGDKVGPAAEAGLKAGEALARVVAAEFGSGPEARGPASREPGNDGPLAVLLLAASGGDAAWREAIPRLLAQLVANEVVEPTLIAERFVVAAAAAAGSPETAAGWLALAKVLAVTEATVPGLPAALVEAKAIDTAARLMQQLSASPSVQLAGLEAMSMLVGTRWNGLAAFAEVGGIVLIEAAVRNHGEDILLQTKGIRALGSATLWPVDVQIKARFDSGKGVALTKEAMSRHLDAEDLCQAGLDALLKYIQKASRKIEAADANGAALVEDVMGRHPANANIQRFGKQVLDAMSL